MSTQFTRTEVADHPGSDSDSFTRAAGKQLLLIFIAGFVSIGLVMVALARLTDMGDSARAVDPVAQSITLSLGTEPPQLDSTKSTDATSFLILGHVMEGLLRYDMHNRLVAGVAERWNVRADGATFWLRDDARWSDGEPVTAEDFVYAWKLAVNPSTASQYSFIFYMIRNARAINEGELPVESLGVRAIDARTLEVEFERPTAYFDKLMAFGTFMPVRQDFYEQTQGRYGADADELLYNGAFTIAEWVHGASIRLEKNEHYWDRDAIRLNVIDMAYITNDTNASLNLFKDGKIASAGLSADTLQNALENHWKIQKFSDGAVFYLELNHRPERLTHNYHLRKALQLAFDPGELVYKVIRVPGNIPGESLFPVWLKGVKGRFRQEYPATPHRVEPARAREHLEIAKDELGVAQIPPLVLLVGDSPDSQKQAEYVQDLYRRTLGLEIKIDRQIFKQRLAKMTSGEFDMVAAGWGPDYDDPLTFGDLFASWNKNNRGEYSNPELDRWVRVAEASLDPETRMEAFAEIQRIIYADAVIIPNYERVGVYVTHPQLEGVTRRVVGHDPDYTYAWVKD
ncbi:MAG: peptide ABC transporter substrate-binding protein [Gammaproteobacteria bacterium]|nr:peptide ABC transporter substrate-binding protein [Gammaproteobacteria bacterium]